MAFLAHRDLPKREMYGERRIFLARLTTVLAGSVSACTPDARPMKTTIPSLPHSILPDVPWSFSQALPESSALLQTALAAYAAAIQVPLDVAALHAVFPGNALDIDYAYAARNGAGAWVDVPQTVRIRRDAPPTYLDILYTLHAAAQVHLGGQDHCFFEGLWLQERAHEPNVPLYRLHTGG